MIQQKIKAYIDTHHEEILALYEELVNLEARGDEKENLDAIAEFLHREFTRAGVECEYITYGDDRAPKLVVGVMGADRPGRPVCFGGHYDTVFKKGTFGDKPFRIEDGIAYGPGVLDMKGGIIIALYAIQALQAAGFEGRPVKICFCGDEDGGYGKSHEFGNLKMREYVSDSLCFLNMETSRPDNKICPGRKGGLVGTITVTGVPAHSGNDYLTGRNSIVEMAYKIIDLYNLRDLSYQPAITTTTPAIISGGTSGNCVPEKCTLTFDGRVATFAEQERLVEGIKKIVDTVHIEGTHTTLDRLSLIPPLDKRPQNVDFFNFSNEVAKKYGYPTNGDLFMGGGSDASFISMHGLPTMCACGIRGQWNHTEREYAIVESLYERALLWATVITEISEDVFAAYTY